MSQGADTCARCGTVVPVHRPCLTCADIAESTARDGRDVPVRRPRPAMTAPQNTASILAQPRAVTEGYLNCRAVSIACPVCAALPGKACEVDPAERPYLSTMRVGGGDLFHIARSRRADAQPGGSG